MAEGPQANPAAVRRTFSTPVQGFFAGGGRRSHLERLRDLSGWPQRVLLVTGPRGIGKSTLYRQLGATVAPGVQVARVSGALVSGAREVLNALVQGFGLAAAADAELEHLGELVAEHVQGEEARERGSLVIVDDAELLEPRALDELLQLVADTRLRLLLFGEARLTAAVQSSAGARDVDWEEIRLRGLSAEDVQAYLEWRFRLQGHIEPLPFSEAQVKDITRLSEGLPGRIDQMANVLLARIQSGARDSARRFPVLHRAVLAVLVVVIAFAYFLWRPLHEGDGEEYSEVQRLEVPPARAPASAAAPAPPAGGALPEAPEEPADTPAESADTTAGSTQATGESAASPAGPAPAPDASSAAPAAAPPDDSAAEPPAPSASAVSEPAPETSGPRDAAWVMRQPGSHYTLQLASFSTAERASAFLARQQESGSFARFRKQQDGRILHVVIYGAFGSRDAAQAAAAHLPDSVGRVKPWVRSFEQEQAAIRTALQD